MSTRSQTRVFPFYRQIVTHFHSPLFRNGYFLIASSVATSGIGLLYWVLAARMYPAYVVGINSAVIAAMTFLAGIAELNLMSALVRFIPAAGRSTKSFVFYSYLVSLVMAVVVGTVFIIFLPTWSPALTFLGSNPVLAGWFILSIMGWCIFVLQDSVLTGLRQASWVPLENTLFSVIKIAIMVILAGAASTLGIFASWSLSLIAILLPTNYFIFRKLIPAHVNHEDQTDKHIEPRQIIRFVAADYVGALFLIISTTLMPVIVTTVSGATANAYFYLSWTIANSLFLIAPGMGQSLVVEAVKDQHKLATYSRRVFINAIRLVIPAVLIVTLSAPYILMIFGENYSEAGSTLLRLLALSAIPHTINIIFLSVSRVQRQMKAVLITLGTLCVMVLSLSYTFLRSYGIVGVGMGWLISQTFIAGVVYMTQLRVLWTENEADQTGLNWRNILVQALYKITTKLHIFPLLTLPKQILSKWQGRRKVSNILSKIIADVPQSVFEQSRDELILQQVASNDTDMAVAFLGPSVERPSLVVKLPGNPKEFESLKRQNQNLSVLRVEESLGTWRQLLPVTLFEGNVDGQAYFLERALPGEPLLTKLDGSTNDGSVLGIAAATIGVLHQKTTSTTTIDMDMLMTWIREPIENLNRLASKGSISRVQLIAIEKLETELHSALIGKQVRMSWMHGDYSPNNILINSEGDKVTGIVDWDLARPNSLPSLDIMHLIVSVRMNLSQHEMGHIVRDLLLTEDWKPEEIQMFQNAGENLLDDPIDLRTILLLSWSHHINANLSKTSRYDHHPVWISENIIPVLKVL